MADKDQINIEKEDDGIWESIHTLPSKDGDQRWGFEITATIPHLSDQFNYVAHHSGYSPRTTRVTDKLPTDVGAFSDTAWGGPFRTQRRAEIAKDAMISRVEDGVNPYTGRDEYKNRQNKT